MAIQIWRVCRKTKTLRFTWQEQDSHSEVGQVVPSPLSIPALSTQPAMSYGRIWKEWLHTQHWHNHSMLCQCCFNGFESRISLIFFFFVKSLPYNLPLIKIICLWRLTTYVLYNKWMGIITEMINTKIALSGALMQCIIKINRGYLLFWGEYTKIFHRMCWKYQ